MPMVPSLSAREAEMSGAERCDEILRLIDEVLATCEPVSKAAPARSTPRATR
jgi:hypothetical protein